MTKFRLRGLLLIAVFALLLLVPSAAAVSTTLVINEVDYDQPSTDAAEFLELKNVSGSPLGLGDFTVELVNGTGGGAAVYQTIALPDVMLAAGGFFVVCADAGTTANCDLDVSPDSNLIQNGAPDAIGLRDGADLVDAVSYEGDSGAPYTEGSGSGVEDDASSATGGISRCPDGSDTDRNNVDFRPAEITPGAANDCPPPPGAVVVNEVDYDQPGTDAAEFVELKNISSSATNLDTFSLEIVNGASTPAVVATTVNLSDVDLAAGDYYVVCANAATTANCDLDVSTDTNLIQNGAPDAVALRESGNVVDTVSYEGDTAAPYTEGSGVGLVDDGASATESISRCADGADTDQNNVDFQLRPISPGATNDCPPPPNPVGACGDPATLVSAVQGSGPASPLVGTAHTIEGVVVGDFQGADGLNGFFMQEEDADADSDPATSEGIFVFDPVGATVVAAGDLVRVRGTVSEFFGMTQLGSVVGVALCSSGNDVTTTDVSLPAPSPTNAPAAFEPLEGMHVRLPQSLVISEYFNYDRFGEIVLGLPLEGETRHFTPTSIVEPGAPAQARLAEYLLRRITLDDGLGGQNPEVTRHPNGAPFSLANRFRGGDTVAETVGVMSWDFGLWRIQPTAPATYTAVNPRPGPLESVDGIRVAAMNMLNFFLTQDFPTGHPLDNTCGPAQNVECRGADADQPLELTRQRDKLLAALAGLDADVIGLNEVENTTGVEPLSDPNGIVPGLNALLGAGTYDAIDTGTIGGDAIKVGLVYKPRVVTPVGDFELLTSAVDPRFDDTLSRPVLAQTFEVNATGARFTVAVNHLKSKGSACPGDPDTGDGQGNCNQTRKAAAQALVDWLATDPTRSDDPDFLILGDLNSYAKEDPVDAILAGADDAPGTGDDYTNLIEKHEGVFAYSFVFDGQAGYLDHALANPTIVEQVLGATEWHINADEPDLLDYDTSFKSATQDGIYEPNQFRSADHDPLVVTLCADLTACAADRLEEIADDLDVLIAANPGTTLAARLRVVANRVADALAELGESPPDRHGAIVKIETAANALEALVDRGLLSPAQGDALLDGLALSARLLPVDAIEEAKAAGRSASKIDDAEQSLAEGDAQRAAGAYTRAIIDYKQALSKAESA